MQLPRPVLPAASPEIAYVCFRRDQGGQRTSLSVDRDRQGVSEPTEAAGQMTFAANVFDEIDLAGTDDLRFAVACLDLVRRIKVHDILSPGRRVPIEEPIAGRRAKDDAFRGERS